MISAWTTLDHTVKEKKNDAENAQREFQVFLFCVCIHGIAPQLTSNIRISRDAVVLSEVEMKQIRIIVIAVLVVLGAAAGAAKIMRMPQELEFFQELNLGAPIVVIFGVVQVIGAFLLPPPRTRLLGAAISDLTFTLSAVMIFLSGAIGFGLIALIPAILAGAIMIEAIRTKQRSQH